MVYFKRNKQEGLGYTKAEVDAKLALKTDKTLYDDLKNQVDDNIADIGTKANSADVYTKTETYNKTEIDAKQTAQDNNIDTNRQSIETNATNIQGLQTSKANIGASYTKAESDNKYATKTSVYTKTESDDKYLNKTADATFSHKFTIQSNDENLKLKSNETARSCYIGIYKGGGNDRVGYIGRASGSNHHIQVVAEKADGNVILQAGANGVIECKNKRVIDVATPTANNDATNKTYVDNKVNGIKLKQQVIKRNIPNATNFLLLDRLNQGRKIAGYEMYRKRANDGWYFKRPETTYQLIRFEDRLQIYPAAENGFTNDWWIIINYFEY